VHLSDGSASTDITCAQAEAGALPAAPTVVVGQQYLLDGSRVPDGTGSLWIQRQELPYTPKSDSAGIITTTGTWT